MATKKKETPVTTEEFDEALADIVGRADRSELFGIPGFYELAAEHYNNEAIECALEMRAAKRAARRRSPKKKKLESFGSRPV